MFARPTGELRDELLALNGVGPETADSILLYAGNHPVFVVDAYTRRILERHQILPEKTNYEDIRKLFQQALSAIAHPQEQAPADAAQLPANQFRGASHPPSAMSTAERTHLAQVHYALHWLIVGAASHY